MYTTNYTILKYVFFNIFKPFFVITLVLTGLVWLSRSLKYVDLIINKGLSFFSYFWFVSLIAPKILAILLPLISFVAILYTYHKLSSESELIIMESIGLSKLKLCIPAFIFGILAALLVLAIETLVSPNNYKKFKSFQSDLRNDFVISALQEGSFHSPLTDITVYVDKILKNGSLQNILIHDTRNQDIESTILAKKGIISNIQDKPNIIVFNGVRYLNNKTNNQSSVLNFDKYEFQIDYSNTKSSTRFRQAEERSLKELIYPQKKHADKILNEFYSEAHRRLSSPLLVIFMCTTAASTVLFGKMKKRTSTRKIFFLASFALVIQALYITLINNLVFSISLFILLYLVLILFSILPILVIRYEEEILKIAR